MIDFPTIADDAKPFADKMAETLKAWGFKIITDKIPKGLTIAPAFYAKRKTELVVCEVASKIDLIRLYHIVSFARQQKHKTLANVVVLPGHRVAERDLSFLKEHGFGLFRGQSGGNLTKELEPRDLALKPTFPELMTFPFKARAGMGPAYDQFRGGHWAEGFEIACIEVEQRARAYLIHAPGRVSYISSTGKPVTYSSARINKLTMGQLKEAFAQIVSKTLVESTVERVLTQLNPVRVEVAHRRGTPKSEEMVRKSVEPLMWAILEVIKELS